MEIVNVINSKIIFSVVIPVYNQGDFLRESITSVLKQDSSNYEIIIIDDGSVDNTRNIVSEFVDMGVRYYYQEHRGLAVARNKGIHCARGSFIAFLDSDDIWYPQKLQRCYDSIVSNPECSLFCHYAAMKYRSGNFIKIMRSGPYQNDMFRRLLFRGNCLILSATVVSREALIKVGLFREHIEFLGVEDYDLWLRFSKRYEFHFISEILGEYIIHGKNMSIYYFDRQINNEIEVVKHNFDEYEKKKTIDYFLLIYAITKKYIRLILYSILRRKIGKSVFYMLRSIRFVFS